MTMPPPPASEKKWKVGYDDGSGVNDDGYSCITCGAETIVYSDRSFGMNYGCKHDDALRIVECRNALEGIENPASYLIQLEADNAILAAQVESLKRQLSKYATEREHDWVPDGYSLAMAYTDGKEVVIVGSPDEDKDTALDHNCDALGCSSVSHVVIRVGVPAYATVSTFAPAEIVPDASNALSRVRGKK